MTLKLKKTIVSALSACFAAVIGLGVFAGGSPSVTAETAAPQANTVAPTELFQPTDAIQLTGNVDSPDYVTNGYGSVWRGATLVTDGYRTNADGETVRYVPEYHENGIKANFTAAKHSLTYKNIIDVSKLTPEVPLFDFLPLVTNQGVAEATKITVRLEDVYDPDNYIAVVFADVVGSETWTRLSAYTDKVEKMGYYWNDTKPGSGAETRPDGVRGYQQTLGNVSSYATTTTEGANIPTEDRLILPFSLRLNPEDYTVSVCRQSYHDMFVGGTSGITGYVHILTLTDEKAIGAGNSFTGFTNDRARISVTIDSLAAAETSLMIYNIAGQPMGGERIVDETAPDLSVYTPKDGLPYAVPNKTYPLFDFVATDFVNGNCTDTIYIKEPNSSVFTVHTGTEFTPTTVGEYVIRYQSVDGFGNANVQDFPILCSWLIDGISITHDEMEKTEYSVGDTVRIPAYYVSGGVGDIRSKYEVYRVSDGGYVETSDGAFLPKIAGEYRIVYSAEDYLGYTADKTLVVAVLSTKAPILSGTVNVPSVFIDGARLQMPTVDAYDYDSVAGLRLAAKLKITVSGNGQEEVLNEDRLFTPSVEKFGTDIKITYKYYCRNYPDEVGTVKTYDCKIRKANYAQDYFHYDESAYDVSYNTDNSDSFLRFTLKKAGVQSKISFVNPVIGNSAIVNFAIEKGYQNFDSVRITFTDMNDADIGFFVDVSKKDKTTSNLTYLGETYSFSGAFNNDEDKAEAPLGIGYNNGNVVNFASKKICEVTQNFDGSKFTGFPSNYVKIDISFMGGEVNEETGAATAIKLTKIRKQNFYANYENGALAPFKDIVRPDVTFNFDSSVAYQIGDVIKVPTPFACDELTPYMEVYVTVSTPSLQKIYNKQLYSEDMQFTVETYGNYVIEYLTYDGVNLKNSASAVYATIRDRVPPTITITDATTMYTDVGERVVLPEIVLLDNYDSEVIVTVFAIDAHGQYVKIAETVGEDGKVSYVFESEKAGEYRIMFYAQDKAYNSAFAEMKMMVKE